jgi:2-phosphosulfolactate phosphatase
MKVKVVLLPRDLAPGELNGHACAVFDVLRATTTIVSALACGVAAIKLFGDLDSARAAATKFIGEKLLCGETRCLPPAGFDLGNSPGQFKVEHHGATLFMSTTNGTRALIAAREADVVFIAALVNAAAVAAELKKTGRDVVLLCAGTDGQVAMEDVLGAGAVIDAMGNIALKGDAARMALTLFRACRADLSRALRDCQGGRNVIAAELQADIEFAARLNSIDAVGVATGDPLTVRRLPV